MKPYKVAVISVIGLIAVVAVALTVQSNQRVVESGITPTTEPISFPAPPVVSQSNKNQKSLNVYDEAIKEIEKNNPELNPDLPGYRGDMAQAILQRMEQFTKSGISAPDA